MRIISRAVIIAFLVLSVTGLAVAQQNAKVGHVNTTKLLQMMPGRDSAQLALQNYAKSLRSDLEQYQKEFEKKYKKYMNEKDDMPKLMRQTREEELTQMQERIGKYQKSAQQDLKSKEQELLQPILEKAQNAIDKVAEENGYTYILDTSAGAVVYYDDNSDDIMPLVKKKLGIEHVKTPEDVEADPIQPATNPELNME